MARPAKQGLEYYPQDTDIHSDRKIRRLVTEFGATGYMVYDYIKCLCYKENGYYAKYEEGFAFDIADFLKAGITENLVKEIIKGCFRTSLFDRKVFDAFYIITSGGIQKRFLKIKKSGVILPEHRVIDAETPISEDITPDNDAESTQRKEKKIKVKERKDDFKTSLEPFRQKYGDEMLLAFARYWGEAAKNGKLKFELEDTWELNLRLITWHNRDAKFNKGSL